MSQRESGYERKAFDLYETPAWVTHALCRTIDDELKDIQVWEPAAGSGKMADVIAEYSDGVFCTDLCEGPGLDGVADFLSLTGAPDKTRTRAVITNPPYNQAQEFCRLALQLMEPAQGLVAMLLRVDFDSAKSRRNLFCENPAWRKKIVLVDRIRWFEGDSSPSFNHAWYLWDWTHEGPATIAYAGKVAA